MNGNVYITRPIPEIAEKILKEAGCRVEKNPEDRVLSQEELIEKVRGRDAVLCLLTDRIDREVLDAAQGVRVFANYAVGYNNIDVAHAREKGIAVTNTPGVLTEATADLAWSLLMSAARKIPEADRYVREGKFKSWGALLFLGADISGKTLGIIGPGRIGSAVARRAAGFGMRVLLYGRSGSDTSGLESEIGAQRTDFETLLTQSDFISLHVPLTEETRYLIGREELGRMKPGAILINTSRGPVVDEKALVQALREGPIAAAGLDVYEDEPALAEGLIDLPNTVLLPHIGSATTETRERMAVMTAENILACLRGQTPPNAV